MSHLTLVQTYRHWFVCDYCGARVDRWPEDWIRHDVVPHVHFCCATHYYAWDTHALLAGVYTVNSYSTPINMWICRHIPRVVLDEPGEIE